MLMVNTLQPGSPPASDITVSQMLECSFSGRAPPLVILPLSPSNHTSRATPLYPLAAIFSIVFSIVLGVVGRSGLLVPSFMALLSATMHESCQPPGGGGGGLLGGFAGCSVFLTRYTLL